MGDHKTSDEDPPSTIILGGDTSCTFLITTMMLFRRTLLALISAASCAGSDGSLVRRPGSASFTASDPEVQPAAVLTTRSSERALGEEALRIKGNNGYPSEDFPLGICQGDCDTDDECEGDLVCFQRDAYEAVPGCSGGESEYRGNDFCIYPQNLNGGGGDNNNSGGGSSQSSGNTGDFKLKMYWQYGYHWQGETFERKWCIRCYKGHCIPGAEALIADCDNGGPAKVYFEKFGSVDFRIRVKNTDICLEIPQDLQLFLSWETCSDSVLQRFTGENGDPYGGGRFQLEPKTLPDHCITITHHPKSGERLWVATCEYTLPNDTTFWNPYQ